jgi:hypothetical protein
VGVHNGHCKKASEKNIGCFLALPVPVDLVEAPVEEIANIKLAVIELREWRAFGFLANFAPREHCTTGIKEFLAKRRGRDLA